MISWDDHGGEETPVVSDHLNTTQRKELDELIHVFRDVPSNLPGKTHIAEHRIKNGATTPIR